MDKKTGMNESDKPPEAGLGNIQAAIAECTNDRIWIVDREYRLVFCNRVFREHSKRFQGQELKVGDNIFTYSKNSETNTIWRANYDRVLNSGESIRVDIVTQSVSEKLFYEYEFNPVRDESRVTGVIVIGRDITAHKHLDDQRRFSEAKYRALVEQANEMLFLHDLQGNIVDVNRAAINQTGFNREELLAMTVYDIDPDAGARDDRDVLWKAIASGEKHIFEVRHRRKDGSFYPAEVSIGRIEVGETAYILAMVRDISERKQNENLIRKEKEFSEKLIDALPDGFVVLNTQGVHLYVNPAFTAMTGFSAEELVGSGLPHVYWVPEKIEEIQAKFMLFQEQKYDSFELTFRKKNGEQFPVIVSTAGITDLEGNITNYFAIFKDISDRRHYEIALRESETNARAVMEASSGMIVLLSKDGIVLDTNSRHARRIGMTRDELMGKCIWDCLPPEHAEKRSAWVKEVVETGRVLSGDDLRDGLWSHYVISPIIDPDGKVDKVAVFLTDITERKQAEEKLQVSERRARALLDTIPDLMFRLDRNSIYLDYKADKSQLYHQTNSIIGRSNFDITPPGFARFIDQKVRETLEKQVLQVFEYTLPVAGLGDRIYEARMMPSGENEVTAIVRDITEKKAEEREMIVKNEQLREINAEKDKFFSIIAHDLRSPFNAFLNYTQLMAEDIQTLSLDQLQKMATSMRRSALNLWSLLENLLEWSRLQRGIATFEPGEFRIHEVVTDCLEAFQTSAQLKEVSISTTIPERMEVYTDLHMLETIVRNLVSNALKFTPRGGKIAISATNATPGFVEVSVNDSGIGMPPDILNNLFRITEINGRKGTEGEPSTGLGLILCREFIEKSGGSIRINSTEGKGTTVSFTLPAVPVHSTT